MVISNNSAVLRVDPKRGGRITSLRIHGREVLVTAADAATDWGVYPMVPWAGRLSKGRFQWKGRMLQLPINLHPHALHGTVFDSEWTQTSPNTLRCSLGAAWPWEGEARSTFELSETGLEWRLEVHSLSEAFPVVVGWHPWFRRNLASGDALEFSLDAEEMYVREEDGVPSGALCKPTEPPWDDCFRGVRTPPGLVWPRALRLKLESTCDHWVVYSEPPHALCVEPQSGPPDAFNLGPVEIAEPERPVIHTFRMQWGRDP